MIVNFHLCVTKKQNLVSHNKWICIKFLADNNINIEYVEVAIFKLQILKYAGLWCSQLQPLNQVGYLSKCLLKRNVAKGWV